MQEWGFGILLHQRHCAWHSKASPQVLQGSLCGPWPAPWWRSDISWLIFLLIICYGAFSYFLARSGFNTFMPLQEKKWAWDSLAICLKSNYFESMKDCMKILLCWYVLLQHWYHSSADFFPCKNKNSLLQTISEQMISDSAFFLLPSSPSFQCYICLCACGEGGGWRGGEYSVQTMQDDKYIIFEVLCISFCWSCEPWCAHPCQWGTIEMTIIVIIMLG